MAVPIPAASPLWAITDTQYTKTAPQASVCGAYLWLYRFCDDFTARGHSLVRWHTEQPAQDTSDTWVDDLLALLSIGVDVMGKETPWDKDVVMKHIVPCEEVVGRNVVPISEQSDAGRSGHGFPASAPCLRSGRLCFF